MQSAAARSVGLRVQTTSFAMGDDSSITRTLVVPNGASASAGSSADNPVGSQQARPIARSFFMAAPFVSVHIDDPWKAGESDGRGTRLGIL